MSKTTSPVLTVVLKLFSPLMASVLACFSGSAATPPTISVAHTSTGPIFGGLAADTSGTVYFSTQGTTTTKPRVTALNHNTTQKWLYEAPAVGSTHNMYAVPAIDSAGQKLYIGSDAGIMYCLNTVNGGVTWSYTVPTGTDRRVRSGAALDVSAPLGPTVYFHCNNGFLYALNATTGGFRWAANTGNFSPPTSADHLDTVSSTPVIGSNGTIYVGSANGNVYAFNPSTGALAWPSAVSLGSPIEATLSIGADGWLYVGTRYDGTSSGGSLFAINAGVAILNPSLAVEWSFQTSGVQPGIITSAIIDQSGFVYVADFHDTLLKLHPKTGSVLKSWGNFAKYCQTPSINQDGLIIVGTSTDASGIQSKRAIRAYHTGKTDTVPWWSVGAVAGVDVGDFLGAAVIRCDTVGTTWLADTTGRVYKFTSGAPLMAGDWPTFQCGNRRIGKIYSYPYAIAPLGGFYSGYANIVKRLDSFGRAAGQAYGGYNYPYGSSSGLSAAVWKNLQPKQPAGYYYATANTFASAVNNFGDVAGYDTSTIRPLAWLDGANSDGPQHNLLTPGFAYAYTADMNSQSSIIGYAYNNSTATHVFRWTKSGNAWFAEDLSTTSGNHAYAYAISENDRIAGKAIFAPGGVYHAYVTLPNALDIPNFAIDLGTLGGLASEAWDTDDESGTVGWANTSAGYRRAFYIQVDAPSLQAYNELPRLAGTSGTTYNSEAYSVNRLGQVAGKVQNDAGSYRAFLFTPGGGNQLADITNLTLDGGTTPASSGWVLTSAVAVNDGGVIVGNGTKYGSPNLWILYPKCQE